MIAFEILLNGEPQCIAGVGDLGVISAIICWVRRKALPAGTVIPDWEPEELSLDVGGIDSHTDEHLKWIKRAIAVGDEITLRVFETDRIDPPEIRMPWPPNVPRQTQDK